MSNLQRNGVWRRSLKRHSLANTSLLSASGQLRRSASFNSSGRSSSNYGDCPDEAYSDISLEDDVSELSHKVRSLVEQVNVLSECGGVSAGANNILDSQQQQQQQQQQHQQLLDSFTRSRHENGRLQSRVLLLEESVASVEQTSSDRLEAERARHQDHVTALNTQHQLQLDNVQLRLQCEERESVHRAEELERVREQFNQSQQCVAQLQQQLNNTLTQLTDYKQRVQLLESRNSRSDGDNAPSCSACSHCSVPDTTSNTDQHVQLEQRCEQLQLTTDKLRADNATLKDLCDEMHVQLLSSRVADRLQDQNHHNETRDEEEHDDDERCHVTDATCLAQELQQQQQQQQQQWPLRDISIKSCPEIRQCDEVDSCDDKTRPEDKWRRSYLDQLEVNRQLRVYIDNILLNIVEHHPELLEVKHQPPCVERTTL